MSPFEWEINQFVQGDPTVKYTWLDWKGERDGVVSFVITKTQKKTL